LINYSLLAAV